MATTIRTYRHTPNVSSDPSGTLVDTEVDADDGDFSVSVDTTGWSAGGVEITVTAQKDGETESLHSNALALTVQAAAGDYPTVGVGQATPVIGNSLVKWSGFPTYNACSMCGYYYHSAMPTAEEGVICTMNVDGGSSYMAVRQNTNNVQIFASGDYTYSSTIKTLVPGNWYFWAFTQNGTEMRGWIEDVGTDIAGSGAQALLMNPKDVAGIMVGAWYNTTNYTTGGYHARIRGWSAILSLAEFNAERVSATPVKAGVVVNAPLTSLADLGGFSVVGTLTTGP
jgi:hypothetical protein